MDLDARMFPQLASLNDEVKYTQAVKGRAIGMGKGLRYVELSPITGNSSAINGSNFLWNITADTAMLDTSRSEILYDITPTFTGGVNVYPESSAAPFQTMIVRSLGSGSELTRVNYYNKLNNIMRRLKQDNFGSLSKEGCAVECGLGIGDTTAVGGFVSALKIADKEYAPVSNYHRAVASGGTLSLSCPLRGLGIMSLTGGEHGKFVPLALCNGLQLEAQLANNAAELFFGEGVTGDGAITATISNIRIKLALVDYDASILNVMKESVRKNGLILSVPRWHVTTLATTSTSINFQIGLVATSVRSVLIFNDKVAQANNASFCHLSTSPMMSATSCYLQVNGEQYPNRALTSQQQFYTYLEEAIGGFGNAVNFAKYQAEASDASVIGSGDATFSVAVQPSLNVIGFDLDSCPSASTINGKPSGVGINVILERGPNDNRTFYFATYYDTMLQFQADGSITELQVF